MNALPMKRSGPLLIAHRGARSEAPENTLSAFRQAMRYPIDGIEFDVQMSKDDRLVIHHDETLFTISGGSQRMADVEWDYLEQQDWGKWFHESFSGEPPATLEDVLSTLGQRTRLFIEIKSYAPDRQSGHIGRLVDCTMTMLAKATPILDPMQTAILSFDPEVLMRAHHQADQWRYVFNAPEEDPDTVMKMPSRFLNILWAIDIDIRHLSADLVRWARSKGLKIMTYTCNNPKQVQKALALGVDAILSDNPGWLCRYMAKE